jgi:hypothetical protein
MLNVEVEEIKNEELGMKNEKGKAEVRGRK